MTRLIYTFLLFTLAQPFYSSVHAVDLPTPFEASYTLHSMGTKFARMQRSFSRTDNGDYMYHSDTRTVGLFALIRKDNIIEKSTWHFKDGTIQPLFYSYEHKGGKKERDVKVNFDWSKRQITNSINGSSWQMPIQAYIMDKLLYQLAIMYDLDNGKEKISYTVADGGKIKTYDFELVGEETIKTPLGKFQSLKLVRHKPNSKRKTTIWCAKDLGYMPVKVENIENNGRMTTAVIESLTGIEYENPRSL